MEQKLSRETAIIEIMELLKKNPFTLELKVKKKPQGIKIIYEVTPEEMEAIMYDTY